MKELEDLPGMTDSETDLPKTETTAENLTQAEAPYAPAKPIADTASDMETDTEAAAESDRDITSGTEPDDEPDNGPDDEPELFISGSPLIGRFSKSWEPALEQELHGSHVRKLCGCAVVTVDDVTVALPLPITYEGLLSALVRLRYDANRAEAITANYLEALAASGDDDKRTEHLDEYARYQAWRSQAKAVAKEVMGV